MLGIPGVGQWVKRAWVSTERRKHMGYSASLWLCGDVSSSLEADRRKDRLQVL